MDLAGENTNVEGKYIYECMSFGVDLNKKLDPSEFKCGFISARPGIAGSSCSLSALLVNY